jgi:hypothetical protein
MSKMTPWFPPHIKPVNIGVYEVKFTPKGLYGSYFYAMWNGKRWSRVATYEEMARFHSNFDALQGKYWRGFKEKQT